MKFPAGAFPPPHRGNSQTVDGSELLDTLIQEMSSELSTVPMEGSPGKKVLITTFVELNNLKKTSAFGRILSERLMTALSDLGFPVIEIRRGHSIYIIEREGEMVLTRNTGKIPDTIHTDAVIYGTYLASEREVLITARIARASDFRILKSWNGKIPRTSFIGDLLMGDEQQSEESGVYEYMLPQ
ncbi:MAG: FlgO family outer membrane protein [bacterium]